MKMCVLMVILLCFVATLACAKQPNLGQGVLHELVYEGCHFKMTDAYKGSLTLSTGGGATANYYGTLNPKAKHVLETWIQFSCENPATAETLSELAGIKMTASGWALDPSPKNLGPKNARTTFHALHGKDWSAGGVTQDDINGDEDRRTRIYAFCIPHRQLALCGVVRDVAYLKYPRESVLPEVIQLLESIEFIDTPAPAGSSTKP